jgi:large subunit ribosomal protein L25
MSILVFTVTERKTKGTGPSRKLRRQGLIPIVIYHGHKKNLHLYLEYKQFFHEYSKGNILSRVSELKYNQATYKGIIKEVQINPVTDKPIHIDFQLVNENELISISIGVKVLNKEKTPGIKKGGTLNLIKKRIQLKCLPKNIPLFLEVDISTLEIGDNIHINEIILPEGSIPVLRNNFTVLTIEGRAEEKEEKEEKTPQLSE